MFVRLASGLAILSAFVAAFVVPMHVSPAYAVCSSSTPSVTTDAPAYSVGSVVAIQGCGFLDYIGQSLPIVVTGGYGNKHMVDSGVVLIDPSGNFAYNLHLSAATSQDYVFGYIVEVTDTGGLFLVTGLFDVADCGDADLNSAANSIDAQLILQVTAGLLTPPSFFPLLVDVNRDNLVDSRDALLILQFTAGLSPTLSCNPPPGF